MSTVALGSRAVSGTIFDALTDLQVSKITRGGLSDIPEELDEFSEQRSHLIINSVTILFKDVRRYEDALPPLLNFVRAVEARECEFHTDKVYREDWPALTTLVNYDSAPCEDLENLMVSADRSKLGVFEKPAQGPLGKKTVPSSDEKSAAMA